MSTSKFNEQLHCIFDIDLWKSFLNHRITVQCISSLIASHFVLYVFIEKLLLVLSHCNGTVLHSLNHSVA